MSRALTGFCCYCSVKGIGAATEQEIRNYIAEEYGPKLAAKFKTAYLVPSPLNRRETEGSCP